MNQKNVNKLFAFILERHSVWVKKTAGAPKPWTTDPILQRYRFCNVYREKDKVTEWIRDNWRNEHGGDPYLPFAMAVARLINLPASLALVGYPVPWNPKHFQSVLRKRKKAGERVFNGAYMIHASGSDEGRLKTDYLASKVLNPMWKGREAFNLSSRKWTLATLHNALMEFRDMGSFMAGQVVADAKFGYNLASVHDWWTWAAPGPGSLRGLSRVEFGDINTKYTEVEFRDSLGDLQIRIDKKVREYDMPRISAQDLQNCLCEFDKHERVRLGEGKPKQLYNGV